MSKPKTVGIRDWMSIKSAEFEVRPLTVFYGANGSGKTAVSLALWASTMCQDGFSLKRALAYKLGDARYVLRCIGLCKTEVRVAGEGVVTFEGDDEELKVNCYKDWPWRRAAYLGEERIYLFRRALRGQNSAWKRLAEFGIFSHSSISFEIGEIKASATVQPLRFYVEKNGREIKAEVAPSSDLEFLLLYKALESAQGGLIVIDDVDMHLSGLKLAKYIEAIARAVDSATFVLTTSNADVPTILAKLVKDKKLSVDKLALYYLKYENRETKVKPIKVYEDGTVEELPEVEAFLNYVA